MGNTPHDPLNTLLVGPIDTEQELKLIFELFYRAAYIRQRTFKDKDINRYLQELKINRIEGSVDTVREIELLLDMMKKDGLVMGPIDTPDEARIFMQNMQAQGYIPKSLATVKETLHPVLKAPPIKKRKKRRDTDEEDELDDDDNNPDTPRPA